MNDKPPLTLPRVLAVAVLGAGAVTALDGCSSPSGNDGGNNGCPEGCFRSQLPDGGFETQPDGGPVCFC